MHNPFNSSAAVRVAALRSRALKATLAAVELLAAVGRVPVHGHERQSVFTAGVLEGRDELAPGWLYTPKNPDLDAQAVTAFISACLPRRQEL